MSSAKKQSFFGRGCFSRKLFGLLRYSATMPERIWKVKTPLYDICGRKANIMAATAQSRAHTNAVNHFTAVIYLLFAVAAMIFAFLSVCYLNSMSFGPQTMLHLPYSADVVVVKLLRFILTL